MINKPTKQELQAVRRIIVRGLLLLSPFALLLLLQLFVLPIDTFTFRIWEAALATPYRYPGPYYPNLHIIKNKEYGDRYRLGDPAEVQFKHAEWYTDAYGWRNRPEIERRKKYNVVLLGDSNIVGSFLDQKNTLAEVIDARGNTTAYSYAYGSDHISLYFSDPRMKKKSSDLLMVESKAGNWMTTADYLLQNFHELPDGTLDIKDRSTEFKNDFYKPGRNFAEEKLESRLTKQVMLHWVKASLATEFNVSARGQLFWGRSHSQPTAGESVWRPFSAVLSGALFKPLPDEPQPAFQVRASGVNDYWKTARFISARPDGKILIRFEAKNSLAQSRHRLWIFENGAYRSIGTFVVNSRWQTFEIPVATDPGAVLRFQIDQKDAWQTLSVRHVQVIDGAPLPFNGGAAVTLPMTGWSMAGQGCGEEMPDCRQWQVSKGAFVQTPLFPSAANARALKVSFEARSDKAAKAYTDAYFFEGKKYRKVAAYAFDAKWHRYSLLLTRTSALPAKLQIDFPKGVDEFSIRNFRVVPSEPVRKAEGKPKAVPVSQAPQVAVAGVSPAPKVADDFTVQVNDSPLFGSENGWSAGYVRAKSRGRGRGVVVGPGSGDSAIFAQQFSSQPGEKFKVVARASSVHGPKAEGRIQINWLSADHNFISASIQPLALVSNERKYTAIVTAPAGAVAGTLYVAPGGNNLARYTEMRLLAESSRVVEASASVDSKGKPLAGEKPAQDPFPRPPHLPSLNGPGRALTTAGAQYYFYHAAKAMQRRASERGMDFILFVMPDPQIVRLMPAIKQLRMEGIKVLAYKPRKSWNSGVDWNWYWQKADSHWTEAAVRLTADEILRMWKTHSVANRPFSTKLEAEYSHGFPPVASK